MSSDEYTPTTEEVRREYAAGRGRMGLAIDLDTHSDFNRWLAQVERAAAVKALREAADEWQTKGWADTPRHADRIADRMGASQYALNWMRARADRIESGEGA
jgi:hypothetical protein